MSTPRPDELQLARALHELSVHQVELESQNEELRRAQAELVAARARYFDLYELAPVGYLTLDASGLLLELNLAAAAMLGAARAKLDRKPLHGFIREEDRDTFVRHRRSLMETGLPQSCEVGLVTSDGTLSWVQLSSTRATGPLGEVLVRTAMTGATERKQLQFWGEQHRRLLELVASNQPIAETLSGVVRGYEEKLPGMRAWICLCEGDRLVDSLLVDSLGRSLPRGLPKGLREELVRIAPGPEAGSCGTAVFTGKSVVASDIATDPRWRDHRRHALAHGIRACWAMPVVGASGAVLGAVAFHFDVPRVATLAEFELLGRAAHLAGLAIERERASQALRESKAFSLAILDSVAASIAVLARDGTIVAVNERWRQFGRDNDGVAERAGVGTNYLALKRAAGDAGDVETLASIEGIEAVLDGKLPRFDHEYPCHSPSEKRWFAMSVTPLGATRQHVVITHTDISRARRAADQAIELEVRLHQAAKMQSIGRLAGGVAHDFNNMLGVILGHVEVALESVTDNPLLIEDLEAIQTAAQRSAALTQQLLTFSRKQVVAAKVLDLNASVDGIVGMLARLVGEEVRLTWRPGSALWPIKMDPSQVDQLLTNLCVNARDAIAEHGVITIATHNCAWSGSVDAAAGDYVRLTVTDDGAGISAEVIAHVFEPFFTTKEVGKGTGLGLATVHGVVRQNGGFILVESTPGEGARFAIHLPRHAGVVEPQRVPVAAARPLVTATILLVEDEPAILKVAARILEAEGYRVLQASCARIALDLAERHDGEIALLITDVVMPDMNGADLARTFGERFPHVRLLFMSGYTPDVIAPRGVQADGAHFLQKPFTKSDLSTKVREALSAALVK